MKTNIIKIRLMQRVISDHRLPSIVTYRKGACQANSVATLRSCFPTATWVRSGVILPSAATVTMLVFATAMAPRSARQLADGGTLFRPRRSSVGRRAPDRTARTAPHAAATVEIRLDEFDTGRPRLEMTVWLHLVEVREHRSTRGVEPLHWRLLKRITSPT